MKILIKNINKIISADKDKTLLETLVLAGIKGLDAPCGGAGLCGKCKATLVDGKIIGDRADSNNNILLCKSYPETDIVLILNNTAEIGKNEVSNFFKSDLNKSISRAGIAADIGTTTVSFALVDLDDGSVVSTYSALNPQRVYGSDVINRIFAAQNGKTSLLFELINKLFLSAIEGFKKQFALKEIECLTVSGNTTMLHLFSNVNPGSMGVSPFTPSFTETKFYNGNELFLPVNKIVLLPGASAFIGSDIIAGIAALETEALNKNSMLVDIGTNGEIALTVNDKIFCCSTAAGPALEGAEISCGTGGVKDAVNKVFFDGADISYSTIGEVKATGICGSGLIDVISLMLEHSVIDNTGAFLENNQKFNHRISKEGFKICDGVYISSKDVRQFQLAKSAIYSGIVTLAKCAKITFSQIENVYLCGGMGFFINPYNAVKTGLFPSELINKIKVCGNSSLRGAVFALTNNGFIKTAESTVRKIQNIELSSNSDFAGFFISNMNFNI